MFAILGFVVLLPTPPGHGQDVLPGSLVNAYHARHDHYNLAFHLLPQPGVATFRTLELVFAVTPDGDSARFRWDAQGSELRQVVAGQARVLYRDTTPLPESMRAGVAVEVRCREHRTEIVVGGRRIVRALSQGIGAGEAGAIPGSGHAVVRDASYQRVEPFVFGDDFMRTEEEAQDLGLWEPECGQWTLYSVMERIKANPDARIREGREPDAARSPNPFCLSGIGMDGAAIFTGRPFWSDYTFSASIRSFRSTVGLIFSASDTANCWILRWELHSLGLREAPLQLVRRIDGVDHILETVLVNGRAESWYRLGICLRGDRLAALVDGVEVLVYEAAECTGGRVGLFAQGGHETYFDDVEVRSVDDLMLTPADVLDNGEATSGEGRWKVQVDGLDSPIVARRNGLFSGPAWRSVGWPTWPAQCTTLTLSGLTQGEAGMALAAKSLERHCRVVVSHSSNSLRVVTVEHGRERERLNVPLGLAEGAAARLAVDARNGLLRVMVDDVLRVRLPAPMDLAGPVALYSDSRDPVRFGALRLFTEPERDWEQPVNIARFADDPYMQGWASPRYAWVQVTDPDKTVDDAPRVFVHKGDFYGPFRLTAPVQDGLAFFFGRDQYAPPRSYCLELRVDAGSGRGSAILSREQRTLARAEFETAGKSVLPGQQIIDEKIGALPQTPDTVSYGELTLNRDGNVIWVEVDGKELFAVHDPTPLEGRTLALRVVAPMDFVHLGVQRGQIKDYLFEQAAVDWVTVGNWEVTNRFACDPRWSHLNGRSKGVAALWSKLEFEGDYTVEYYAGMRMRQGDMMEGAARMYYPRVGDINLAMNADPYDLFSGYNVLIAAWDPMWTETWSQFRRLGDILEKNDTELIPRGRKRRPKARTIDVDWDPGGRPVHGAWYFVKMRKTGNRYDVSFDNVPVFSITDPNPLTGKRLALWTQHNSIVIARAKIGYRSAVKAVTARHGNGDAHAGVPTPETLEQLWCTPSHPGLAAEFDSSCCGLTPWNGDQSAELTLVEREDGGSALCLENLYGGGDAGVHIPVRGLDLGRRCRLELDLAVEPDSKVNLYLAFEDRPAERCFVPLTGPRHEGPNMVRLDADPGVVADGQWRRIGLDLGQLARERFPARASYRIQFLMIGMLHEGYLNAGLGGNPAGATYRLDNLSVSGCGPSRVAVEWQGAPTPAPRYAVWLDPAAESLPPSTLRPSSALCSLLEAPGAGKMYLHGVLYENDTPIPMPAIPIEVGQPLTVKTTQPENGARWGGHAIDVVFSDTAGHPDLANTSIEVNGTALPLNAATSHYDPKSRTLRVKVHYAGAPIGDGAEVTLELRTPDTLRGTPATDEDGRPDSPSADRIHRWRAIMDYRRDDVAPNPVLVGPLPRSEDFNHGLGAVTLLPPPNQVDLALMPRAERDYALTMRNAVCGSSFNVDFGMASYALGKYPLLSFDYRIDEHTQCDIMIRIMGRACTVGFTDCDESAQRYLGAVQGVKTDNQWHRAEVQLSSLPSDVELRNIEASQDVTQVGFGDWTYGSNAPGAQVALDNVMLVPVVGVAEASLALTWSCPDPSGGAAFSYGWDDRDDTEVDEVAETTALEASFAALPEGRAFFHLKARDGAGNWGDTAHFPFLVDNQPPEPLEVRPEDRSTAAADTIAVRFKPSLADIDPSKVSLLVNGKKAAIRRGTASWDRNRGEFSWDMLSDWSLLRRPIADGAEMVVELAGIKDFAGNVMTPMSWRWNVDYAADTDGPAAPRLWSYSHNFNLYDDFAASEPHYWRSYDRSADGKTGIEIVARPSGGTCLEVRKVGDGRRFGAYRSRGNLRLEDYPLLAFDYCIMPGTKINLMVYIEREWYQLTMTGSSRYTELGVLEHARDDGVWRHEQLDLHAIVRDQLPDLKNPRARIVAFADLGAGNESGATFYLDNVATLGPACPAPLARFSAADATGISAYRIAFNTQANAQPTLEIAPENSDPILATANSPGIWYIHAQARDGAGNWGETVHHPYLCTEPVATYAVDGWEAGAPWQAQFVRRRRGGCRVYDIESAPRNRLLAIHLVMNGRDEVAVTRKAVMSLSKPPELRMDLFFEGSRDLDVAPCVRVSGGKQSLVVGEKISVSPGTWHRGLALTFGKGVFRKVFGTDNAPITTRQIGIFVYPHRRARDTLLVDHVQVNGELRAGDGRG